MPRRSAPKTRELTTLPSRLKYARERCHMTLTALAKLSGLDLSQVSRIEGGERVDGIEAATIIRLARALQVSVGWLAADEGDPGPIPTFPEPMTPISDRRRRKPSSDKRP